MRAALLVLLLAPVASAQLQVFTVHGTEERPVTGLIAMGSGPAGEPLDVLLRVRNASTQTLATVSTLSIQGDGFSLYQAPTPPVHLVAGFSLDFYVRFRSDTPVSDARANLRLNTATISLLASAVVGVWLYQVEQDGSRTRRQSGESTVFPAVERGSSSTRRFQLENPNSTALPIGSITVTGDSFRSLTTLITPFTIAPRQIVDFTIAFEPRASGLRTGALTIDGRVFRLEGVGRDPVLPRPRISLDTTALESGKQLRVQVQFESEARAEGAGILRLEFQPAMPGPDDPAIAFLNGSRTSVPFLVSPGQSQGLFSGQRETLLQTGTTAGTLRLTAEMGGFRTEWTGRIAPAAAALSSLTARRGVDFLELNLLGFDNTRSAGGIAFTFYDPAGQPVPPGRITASIADPVRRYFETTTTGGSFSLRALFRATAPTTAIDTVEIELENSAGTFRSTRTKLP